MTEEHYPLCSPYCRHRWEVVDHVFVKIFRQHPSAVAIYVYLFRIGKTEISERGISDELHPRLLHLNLSPLPGSQP